MQIAVQGPHNTVTQTVCKGKAPALNLGDSFIKVLEGITEDVAEHQQEFHFAPGAPGVSEALGTQSANRYSGCVITY